MHVGVLLIQSASLIYLVCRCASLATTSAVCTVPVDDVVLFHSMVSDGGLVSNATLHSSGGSALCVGCEGIHFFSVLLHPQAWLPACFPNVRTGAVLARDLVDQLGFLLIFDLVLWMNQDIP